VVCTRRARICAIVAPASAAVVSRQACIEKPALEAADTSLTSRYVAGRGVGGAEAVRRAPDGREHVSAGRDPKTKPLATEAARGLREPG